MARDIASIASFVTDVVLKRTDLTSVATSVALDFYRTLCSNIPFDELMATSAEVNFPDTTGRYLISAFVSDLKAIRDIRITFDSGNRRRLRRSHTRVYDALSYQQASRPATYARDGLSIETNPAPDSTSYTLRFRYWQKPAAVDGTTLLVTPDEWDELLKWETLFRVYYTIGQQDKAMTLVQPGILPKQPTPRRTQMSEIGIIPRLWNDLLTTISAKEGSDEDFSINPIVRRYSIR